MLDSIVKMDNDYNPQIFLEECKYAVKKKKIMNKINEELDLDKSDESDEDQNYILNGFLIIMDLIMYAMF